MKTASLKQKLLILRMARGKVWSLDEAYAIIRGVFEGDPRKTLDHVLPLSARRAKAWTEADRAAWDFERRMQAELERAEKDHLER